MAGCRSQLDIFSGGIVSQAGDIPDSMANILQDYPVFASLVNGESSSSLYSHAQQLNPFVKRPSTPQSSFFNTINPISLNYVAKSSLVASL